MTSATTPDAGRPLPAAVRRGYGLGSVATGSFGTVPGLLLLPYLTDHLGVPAAAAGVIVFAPKAWDVVLNPIALSPELREVLLLGVVDRLARPSTPSTSSTSSTSR